MSKILVSLCIVLITACDQNEKIDHDLANQSLNDSEKVREISPDEVIVSSGSSHYEYTDFKDFYRNFFISLMEDDEMRFNTFINSKRGLYIIDSKGALPVLTNIKDISSYKRPDGRSIFSVNKSTLGFEMLKEDLPKIDCDAPKFYSKTGCFTANTNTLMETMVWQYTNLDENTKEDIISLAETVSVTVVNTANYIYYFSFIDGNWYLTFLDIRTPCEA